MVYTRASYIPGAVYRKVMVKRLDSDTPTPTFRACSKTQETLFFQGRKQKTKMTWQSWRLSPLSIRAIWSDTMVPGVTCVYMSNVYISRSLRYLWPDTSLNLHVGRRINTASGRSVFWRWRANVQNDWTSPCGLKKETKQWTLYYKNTNNTSPTTTGDRCTLGHYLAW